MDEPTDNLKPAARDDLADALAFALRFSGRKRVDNADEIMAGIVAKRLVEHLERSGFVVMKKPPAAGASTLARSRHAERNMRSPYRAQFLDASKNVIREYHAVARGIAGAVGLVEGLPWPEDAVELRLLDADGREAHNRAAFSASSNACAGEALHPLA